MVYDHDPAQPLSLVILPIDPDRLVTPSDAALSEDIYIDITAKWIFEKVYNRLRGELSLSLQKS